MTALLILFAALNVNPGFEAHGDVLNGWNLRGVARFVRDADGVNCVLAEEGSARSELFPVSGGGEIEVTLKACCPKYLRKRKYPWVAVAFFKTPEEAKRADAQWKFARPKLEIRTKWVSQSSETYPVPADAKWCMLTFRNGSAYRCEAKAAAGGKGRK